MCAKEDIEDGFISNGVTEVNAFTHSRYAHRAKGSVERMLDVGSFSFENDFSKLFFSLLTSCRAFSMNVVAK